MRETDGRPTSALSPLVGVARGLGRFLAVYGGWLLAVAASAYAALKIWELVRFAYLVFGTNSWAFGVISDFGAILLGLIWLGLVIYLEDRLSGAPTARVYARRLARALAGAALVSGVTIVVTMLIV